MRYTFKLRDLDDHADMGTSTGTGTGTSMSTDTDTSTSTDTNIHTHTSSVVGMGNAMDVSASDLKRKHRTTSGRYESNTTTKSYGNDGNYGKASASAARHNGRQPNANTKHTRTCPNLPKPF